MKRLITALLLVSAFNLSACDENGAELGNLRVVHLVREAEPLNFLIDDQLVSSELSFTESTHFITAPDENFNLKLTPTTNESAPLYENNFEPLENPTTLYVLPVSAGFRNSITVNLSNNFQTLTNLAALRLMYASIELSFMVDVYVGQNTNNCTNLEGLTPYSGGYAEALNNGQYLDPLEPGLYDICITEPSNASNVLDGLIDFDLKANTKQTLVIFDQTQSTLGFHILNDVKNDEAIIRQSNLIN